ncbi:MAG: hypothetical protein AAFP76_07095 [Bacteroidota bacterium]
MYKRLFQLALAIGIALFAYTYLYDFDKMSETQMLNSVLYWFVPLIFGLYGLLATRVKERIPLEEKNVINYCFSGKDKGLLITIILLATFGVLGFIVLLVPLALFKIKDGRFEIYVALTGAVIMLVILYIFLKVLWPSL